jgi:hypothetical protein
MNRIRRIRRPRRPSASLVISIIALVFAMSGTAVAATGGTFILGKSNSATNVTRLDNSKGTALSLSATPTSPALRVSNTKEVPNLNANYLGGFSASQFVLGNGGTEVSDRAALGDGDNRIFLETSAATVDAFCDVGGTGATLTFSNAEEGSAQVIWWNKDGASNITFGGDTESAHVTPVSQSPYVVVVQMDNGSSIGTYTLTQQYSSVSDSCYFTGQAVVTNG